MRVLATHSIRQFPLHFHSRASPCAIRFRTSSTTNGSPERECGRGGNCVEKNVIMGTGSFPKVKRPGRDVDHPPHLALKFKKEESYTFTSPLGLRGLLQGEL